MDTVKEMLSQMAYAAPIPVAKAIDIATMTLLAGPFAAYWDGPDVVLDGSNGATSTYNPEALECIGQDLLSIPFAHAELETLASVMLVMEFKAGMLLGKVAYRGPDGMYRSCDPTDIRHFGLLVIQNNDPEGSDSFSIWTRTYAHPILSDLDAAAHYLRTRRDAFIARGPSGAVVAATWTHAGVHVAATAEQLATLGSYIHDPTPNAYDRWVAWLGGKKMVHDIITFTHSHVRVQCWIETMPRAACLIDASDFDLVLQPEQMARLFPGRPELHTHTPLADALFQVGAELMEE